MIKNTQLKTELKKLKDNWYAKKTIEGLDSIAYATLKVDLTTVYNEYVEKTEKILEVLNVMTKLEKDNNE